MRMFQIRDHRMKMVWSILLDEYLLCVKPLPTMAFKAVNRWQNTSRCSVGVTRCFMVVRTQKN